MMRELLWKEWRESRPAVIAGAVWLVATALFFGEVQGGVDLPDPLVTGMLIVYALGPFVTLILLAGSRLWSEQHRGTREFLLTRPVPLRQVIAAKWAVTLALGAVVVILFALLFSVLMIQPETTHVNPQGHGWLLALGAFAVLVLAMLLLCDALTWSGWPTLRVALMVAVTVAMIIALAHGSEPTLRDALGWLAVAFVFLAAAWPLAMRFRGDPLLPSLSRRARKERALSQRPSGPSRAVLGLAWHRLRPVGIALLIAPPLSLLIDYAIRSATGEEMALTRGVFHIYSLLFLLPVAGAVLGCLGRIVEEGEGSAPLTRSLPLNSRRVPLLEFVIAVGLYLALVAVAVLFSPLLMSGIEDSQMWSEVAVLMARSAALGLLLLPVGFLLVRVPMLAPWVGQVAVGFIALWVLTSRLVLGERTFIDLSDWRWIALLTLALASPWLWVWLNERREVR
jgi:ABC-2 family transporter protein